MQLQLLLLMLLIESHDAYLLIKHNDVIQYADYGFMCHIQVHTLVFVKLAEKATKNVTS